MGRRVIRRVRVGIIGAGFAAELHVAALRRVAGFDVSVAAVASASPSNARRFARTHSIPTAYTGYADLLADPDIDLVSVCVSSSAHAEIVKAALVAGKDVICEKPLTGAFGPRRVDDPIDRARDEWERARASVAELREALAASGRQFMYAENWVYAPAMAKIERLLGRSDDPILDIRAEESHSGSHADRSRRRETAGGGALLVLGAHATAAAVHLKTAQRVPGSGSEIRVSSVLADVAALDCPSDREVPIVTDWTDVERWANLVLRFSDGSRAVVNASFAMLGGIRNRLEVYTGRTAYRAEITPNSALMAFTPDPAAFGDEYLHEKVESRTGWIHVSPDEDWERGYPQEMQDFVSAAAEGRPARAGFELAASVVDITYAAYLSAAEGREVHLEQSPVATTQRKS